MNHKNVLSRITLTLTACFAAATACAMPVTFDFADGGGNRDVGTELVLSDGGLTVTVTASGEADIIHQNGNFGLGVADGAGGNRVAAFGDGSLTESLFFEFSPTDVGLLESVLFERGTGGPSTFDLLVDGASAGTFVIGGGPNNTQETLDFSSLMLFGSTYEFRAVSGNGFRVSELTVARVAEPGSLALAAIGLAGLGALRRRRSTVIHR